MRRMFSKNQIETLIDTISKMNIGSAIYKSRSNSDTGLIVTNTANKTATELQALKGDGMATIGVGAGDHDVAVASMTVDSNSGMSAGVYVNSEDGVELNADGEGIIALDGSNVEISQADYKIVLNTNGINAYDTANNITKNLLKGVTYKTSHSITLVYDSTNNYYVCGITNEQATNFLASRKIFVWEANSLGANYITPKLLFTTIQFNDVLNMLIAINVSIAGSSVYFVKCDIKSLDGTDITATIGAQIPSIETSVYEMDF